MFVQVVLPLVEKYFRAHRAYFITDPNMLQSTETATIREKEMTARYLMSIIALLPLDACYCHLRYDTIR